MLAERVWDHATHEAAPGRVRGFDVRGSQVYNSLFLGLFVEYYVNDLSFSCGRFVSGCRIAVFDPREWRDACEAIRFRHVFVDDLRIVGDAEAPERVVA